MLLASSSQARPYVGFSVSAGGGHDTQVLAEADRRGLVEPIPSNYGLLTFKAVTQWSGRGMWDRLALVAEATGTQYDEAAVGFDQDLRFKGAVRRRLVPTVALDVESSFLRYRRNQVKDFDVDVFQGEGRLNWSPRASWLITAGARYSHMNFPVRKVTPQGEMADGDGDIGVIVTPIDPQNEADDQIDLMISGIKRFEESYLSAEFTHRQTDSNEPLVKYVGNSATLRGGRRIADEVEVSTHVAYVHRGFAHAYLIDAETAGKRSDASWQVGFGLKRQVTPRMQLFGTGFWLDQKSTIEDFSFNRAGFQMGISMNLFTVRESQTLIDHSPAALVPEEGPDGVRFQFKSAEAGQVFLAGDFNGWDARSHPLKRVAKDLWAVVVPVDAGVWRYAFVVDGTWEAPQAAERYESDEFGGKIGVFEVKADPADVTPLVSTRLNP